MPRLLTHKDHETISVYHFKLLGIWRFFTQHIKSICHFTDEKSEDVDYNEEIFPIISVKVM